MTRVSDLLSMSEAGAPIKLVVVDDSTQICNAIAELLREDGYEVLTAGDGATGLNLIERERPDLAILDIGLPNLDGYEVAKRLRANEETAGIALIAMTGHGHGNAASGKGSFDVHLIKPVSITTVLSTLTRLGFAPPALR